MMFLMLFSSMDHFQENLLKKLRSQKEALNSVIENLCSVIQNSSFRDALIDLDLFDSDPEAKNLSKPDKSHRLPMEAQLDLCKHICQPPVSEKNELAANIGNLLTSDQKTEDMTVIIHDEQGGKDEIECHRVVLCARVPYFRRALQSGMKESIERHDHMNKS